jgi:hypothetical protein
MRASHAARERDSTRAAATNIMPSVPSVAPHARRASREQRRMIGVPMADRCAMKFRLPNVPPGARLRLMYSGSMP